MSSDEDQYLIRSSVGQELPDHKLLFLSKRAAASFGHYADAQLRRLQNAIARDTLSQPSREKAIFLKASFSRYPLECRRQKEIPDTAPDDHKHDYTALNECFRAVLGSGCG